MKKMTYESPELELVVFEVEDIITTSTCPRDGLCEDETDIL